MKRVKRAFKKNRKDFTLAETLAAILILLMVTGIAAVGIPVAAEAYAKMVTSANAQVLLSTTMTRLRDELGTASGVSCSGTVISFTTVEGRAASISIGDEGIQLLQQSGIAGREDEPQRLVSKEAANKDLYTSYSAVTYSGGVLAFTDLCVRKGTGDEATTITKIDTFHVRVLTWRG